MTDYDHTAIDELLQSRARLAIVAFLAESNADAAMREAVLANVARTVYSAYVP